MMTRRIETRTFEYLGEIIEYQHVVFDRPEECQDNPYAEGGRCFPDPRDVVEPARETPARDRSGSPCLTRAQFARAFQAEGARRGLPMPWACVERKLEVAHRVDLVRREFDMLDMPMPRRLRRALHGYRYSDLGFAYDRGFAGRLGYYLEYHVERRTRNVDRALLRYAARV